MNISSIKKATKILKYLQDSSNEINYIFVIHLKEMKEHYFVFYYLDVDVQVCNLLNKMTERTPNCNLDDKEYKRHTCMEVKMLSI